MKEDIKNRWVAALESGKYKQGIKFLQNDFADDKRHCCLGVLCELAVEDGIVKSENGRYDDSLKVLPILVKEWSGMNSADGCYNSITHETLTMDNDSGRSFKQIVETIKAFWPEL